MRVPTTAAGGRLRAVHDMHPREVAAGVPQGTLQVVEGVHHHPRAQLPLTRRCRARLSPCVEINRSALGRLERHWTADEMLLRARAAERISRDEFAKVQSNAPLADQDPDTRRKSWGQAMAAAKAKHLALGVAGLPSFADLHYFKCRLPGAAVRVTVSPAGDCAVYTQGGMCRYENFWHYAVAHLFLYGLVKDFLNIWAEPNFPRERGDLRWVGTGADAVRRPKFVWPGYIKHIIQRRSGDITPTRQWSLVGADVFRSGPVGPICYLTCTPCGAGTPCRPSDNATHCDEGVL